jgi:hypothetical protein
MHTPTDNRACLDTITRRARRIAEQLELARLECQAIGVARTLAESQYHARRAVRSLEGLTVEATAIAREAGYR